MVDSALREASKIEKVIAAAMRSSKVAKGEIIRQITDLSVTEQFVMKDNWVKLSCDDTVENWRRLEAYKILINRCMTYPCDREYFVKEMISSLGIDETQIVDMTMAQCLPMKRKNGDLILMVNLPISTSVGPAAVYFAVRRSTNTVERVVVYPDTVEVDS